MTWPVLREGQEYLLSKKGANGDGQVITALYQGLEYYNENYYHLFFQGNRIIRLPDDEEVMERISIVPYEQKTNFAK